jgi:hypothetical protein
VISAHKRRANRENARASTGPKTAAGKAQAARNSRKHGLRVPVLSDPTLAAQVKQLADEITGSAAGVEVRERAQTIAEAHVDLVRVRLARLHLLSKVLADSPLANENNSLPQPAIAEEFTLSLSCLIDKLVLIDRYERRALSRRKFAIRALSMPSAASLERPHKGPAFSYRRRG